MDLEAAIAWGAVALAIVVTIFAVAAEMALASLSRGRLRHLSEQGLSPARRVIELLETPGRFLTTLLQLKVLALVSAATAVAHWALTHQIGLGNLVLWQALLLISIVLTQIVVRARVVRNPEPVAFFLAPLLRAFTALLAPMTWFYLRVAGRMHDEDDRAAEESIFLSEDGLRFLFNVSEEESQIEEREKEMIGSILELDKTLVREVMVPRIDMVTLEVQTPLPQALDLVIEAGHSRIPVYHETVDNIVGVLYAKDLLRFFREQQRAVSEGATTPPETDLRALMRQPYFVPDSKPVDELLRELQKRRVHIVVVVDEYGGTAGVVTIEDLLEEIVGDIQDEYDEEEPEIERVTENEYILSARASLDEVNDELDIDLPSEGGDTLGGYIYSQLGRVPLEGEEVPFDKGILKVLSVDGNSIDRVRALITRPPTITAEAESIANGNTPTAKGAILSSLFFF